jgi:hypothetical protein
MTIVWEASDGDGWKIEVTREQPYRGCLRIYNKADEVIFKQSVPLAYNAQFGPDIDDVDAWVTKANTVIEQYTQQQRK